MTLEPVPEFTNVSEDKYCIKATARTLEGEKVETFGESSGKNTRIAYPISIAEKRAKARAVLQISKLYSLPVHSEDEADEFKKNLDWIDEMFDGDGDDVELSWSTQTYLLNKLDNSTIIQDEHAFFEDLIISGKMSKGQLQDLKICLEMNQLPEIEWWNPSQESYFKTYKYHIKRWHIPKR